MKRFWTVLSGVCLFLALCVVPSFASSLSDAIMPFAVSSNPSYPSGSAYSYFVGSAPSNSPGYSSSDYFTAVASSLRNGFVTMSKGFYDLQKSFDAYSSNFSLFSKDFGTYKKGFESLSSSLVSTYTGFSYLSSTTGLITSTSPGSLFAISSSLTNGFWQTITQLKNVVTKVNNVDTHLQSGFTGLGGTVSALDNHFLSFSNLFSTLFPSGQYAYTAYNDGSYQNLYTTSFGKAVAYTLVNGFYRLNTRLNTLNNNFSAVFPNRNYFYLARTDGKVSVAESSVLGIALSASLVNGFLQVDADLARIYDLLYDPEDEAIKDATEDQKQEILDNFFGDGGNGVKPGQIGDLGGISSGAGSLLDTGADMGSVFDAVGDPGSSVWSWFTAGNSEAINGAPSSVSEVSPYSLWDDPDLSPSPEIVDFYGAQRDEFLSMLGGG